MVLLLAAVSIFFFGVIVIYNRLVRLRVLAGNAWSDIDVQLKRRHDLIPNLVETVKGYAGHERATFETIAEARRQAVEVRGGTPADRAAAEGLLTQSLRQLFAVAEAYPELRASESFRSLHASLESTEDAIESARRYYNAVVRELNTKVHQFPSNLVAHSFGFREQEFFEGEEAERAVPRVAF